MWNVINGAKALGNNLKNVLLEEDPEQLDNSSQFLNNQQLTNRLKAIGEYCNHGNSLRRRGTDSDGLELYDATSQHLPEEEQKLHRSPGLLAGNMLNAATSVLQKVANHVAGAEDVQSTSKLQDSLALLKQQLIQASNENDELMQQLQTKDQELHTVTAAASQAAHFQEELAQEQLAHRATKQLLLKSQKLLKNDLRPELTAAVEKAGQLEQQLQKEQEAVAALQVELKLFKQQNQQSSEALNHDVLRKQLEAVTMKLGREAALQLAAKEQLQEAEERPVCLELQHAGSHSSTALAQQLQACQQQSTGLQYQLDAASEQLLRLQKQVLLPQPAPSMASEATLATLQQQVVDLQAALEEAELRIADLQQLDEKGWSERYDILRASYDSMHKLAEERAVELSAAQATVAELKQVVPSLQAQCAQQDTALQNLQDQLQAAKETATQYQTDRQKLAEQLKELSGQLLELKEQGLQLQTQLASEQASHGSTRSELSLMETKLHVLQTEKEDLKQEHLLQLSLVESLQQQLAAMQVEVGNSRQQLAELRTDKDVAPQQQTSACDDHNLVAQKLISDKGQLQQELSEQQSHCSQLQQQLDHALQQLQQLSLTLETPARLTSRSQEPAGQASESSVCARCGLLDSQVEQSQKQVQQWEQACQQRLLAAGEQYTSVAAHLQGDEGQLTALCRVTPVSTTSSVVWRSMEANLQAELQAEAAEPAGTNSAAASSFANIQPQHQQLQEDNAQLQELHASALQQLTVVEQQLLQLRQQHVIICDERSQLQEQALSWQATVSELQSLYHQQQQENIQVRQDRSLLQQQLSFVQASLTELQLAHKKLQQRCEALARQRQDDDTVANELQQAYTALQASYRQMVLELEQKAASQQKELRLQELVQEGDSMKRQLQEQLTACAQELQSAQASLEESQEQQQLLHRELSKRESAHQRQLIQLQDSVFQVQQELQQAHNSCPDTVGHKATSTLEQVDLEKALQASDVQLRQCQAQLASLSQEHEQLKQEVLQLRADLATKVAELSNPSKHSSLVEQELEPLSSQYARLQQHCSSLELKVKQLQAVCSLQHSDRHLQTAVDAEVLAATELKLQQVTEQLSASEAERHRLQVQYAALKARILADQETEEDKVSWRVEAEVNAVREQYQAVETALRADLEKTRASLAMLQLDASGWEEALSLKEREVQNLQAALGELTYESEAAERMRLEARTVSNRLQQLQQELAVAKEGLIASNIARQAAEALAQQSKQLLDQRRSLENRVTEECLMLRRALDQAMAQIKSMTDETSATIDKRIVSKLLITYFEQKQSKDVLLLMCRMLNMSEKEQQHVGALGGRKGILGRVVGVLATGPGSSQPGSGDTLADQWVQFLLSQDEAASSQAGQQAKHAGSQLHTSELQNWSSSTWQVYPPTLHALPKADSQFQPSFADSQAATTCNGLPPFRPLSASDDTTGMAAVPTTLQTFPTPTKSSWVSASLAYNSSQLLDDAKSHSTVG